MKFFTLSNGIRCGVKERKDLNSVSVSVWVRTGTAWEVPEKNGIAHFLEHVVFNRKEDPIDERIEVLGGEINAGTSYDYTHYYVTLPAEYLDDAVDALRELLLEPDFSRDMIERERSVVLEEIARSKSDPKEVFGERFMEKLYRGFPYGLPILGSEETVSSITREDLEDFYRSHYVPERMAIAVVGNVPEEKVADLLEESFGRFEREGIGREPGIFEETCGERVVFSHPAVEVPALVLGWNLPPCGKEDIYFEILDSLLSSGRSSILYGRLKETGIAYSAFSSYQGLLFGSNFQITVLSDELDSAEKALREVIEEVLRIDREEISFAKDKLYRGEIFARESGEVEADAMGYALGIVRDKDYYEGFFRSLKEADYETFKRRIKFLEREPLVGILLKG